MKKGPKIALLVFDGLSVLWLFFFGVALLFIGAFAEALVAALTLGYGDANGQLIALFAPTAFMLMIASVLIIPPFVIALLKKKNKVLNIVDGALFCLDALLVVVAYLVLIITLAMNGGGSDSIVAYLVFAALLIVPVTLLVLSGVFMGFKPAFKKPKEIENK